MKYWKLLGLTGILLFFTAPIVSARVRIAFGDREVITKVADLPDTEEYKTKEGNYIDLAIYHKEFTIASALPLYIEKGPRLVGYCEKEEAYYELTEKQLAAILKANNLDGNKLNRLSFYTRYGGKLIVFAVLALIIRGIRSGKKKKTTPIQV